MPLGFDSGVAQAQLAMSERYGDRLVNQLAQAGGMIENGLKAVHTMKELQSLSANLSQISPETPDYQQKLMQLGAAHPFAMQDPRGQALISMGNQQHLQWQHQQYAMQAADRAAGRAEAHDNRMYDRSIALARMKQGGMRVPWQGGQDQAGEAVPTPQAGFSGGAAGQPADEVEPGLEDQTDQEEPGMEAPPPPAGFSGGAAKPAAAAEPSGAIDAIGLFNKNKNLVAQSYLDKNGTVDPKYIPRIISGATALTRTQLAQSKSATGTGFGYKSKDEAISDFGGKPIGGGLYETDDGTVLTVTQSASGKWHWKTPPEDHSALPEFDESGNARLGNTILEKDENGRIRKVGTIPQSRPMAEGKLSELQQSALRSAVSARDKSEAAYSNFKGEYDAALAKDSSKKDIAAAQAKMSNAAKVYRIAAARHDELVKSFKSSSSETRNKVFNKATGKIE